MKINKLKKNQEIEPAVQNILDAIPFGVFLVGPDNQILAANEAIKRDFGADENQLIGAYCPNVVHQLNKPIAECPLTDVLEKGQPVEKEIFNDANGRWINSAVYPTSMITLDGKPIYVHFVRDITQVKTAATELSRSLEHHRALCNLLQNLQHCRSCSQIVDALIDQIIFLSWLGMAATAAGFLSNGNGLELVAHRNVPPNLLKRCQRLKPGECLCGKAAETGRKIVCSSSSYDHSIKYDGMVEHQHVVLPIQYNERTLGVITLYLNPGDKMDDFRLGFLEAAAAATGTALDAQLAREEVLRTQQKYIAQAISYQEDERKRVAYDLHDQLCQSLSAILLEMQSNKSKNPDTGSAQPSIEIRIRELIDQVRQLAGQLRPAILDDYGLESALSRKIKDISGLKGIEIDYQGVSLDKIKERLPRDIEVNLYRIAMEALNNAISHAAASHISVILLWQEGKVTLIVEDDGCGFDYPAVRSNMDNCRGLIEMERRMVVLGGALRIESAPEKGTTVRAEVPVDTVR